MVLEVAAKVENPDSPNSTLQADTFVDKLIFKPCDILTMVARDVDLEYPTKNAFLTDTAISGRLNGNTKLEERELEPWDASTGVNGAENMPLELEAANGWDANDMFRKNEQEYGVQSTYDQSLRGYTVPLQTSDTADYKEAEAKANQIASEIESQPQHKARLELENGDEETIFAAVVRPNTNNMQETTNGKYIPPAKRKNQNSGKLVRSTPPPSQGNSSQNTPSPKGTTNPPPMTYPTHPSPHQNNVHASAAVVVTPAPPTVQTHHHMHNANVPPPQLQQQPPPPQPQQHQVPNHSRTHSHTPPQHGFNQPLQQMRQGPPPNQQGIKSQLNGDTKPVQQQRNRNVYNQNVQQQTQQQQQQQQQQAQAYQQDIKPQDINHPRHREETIKELHTFAQDFKIAAPEQQQMQAPPPVIEQVRRFVE